jgi:Spy/CpxP family protein refolding chaperone
MKRYLISSALLLAFFLHSTPSRAENPSDSPDPIAHALVAPQLIMKYHNEIGLEDSQSKTIKELIQKAQSKFLDLQWEMQGESEKLIKLLNARPTDETAVLAQVDRVLNVEREIKKSQVALMVRIKNTLTSAQLDKLAELIQKQ